MFSDAVGFTFACTCLSLNIGKMPGAHSVQRNFGELAHETLAGLCDTANLKPKSMNVSHSHENFMRKPWQLHGKYRTDRKQTIWTSLLTGTIQLLRKQGLWHPSNSLRCGFFNGIFTSYLTKGWWNLFPLQKDRLHVIQAEPAANGSVLPETRGVWVPHWHTPSTDPGAQKN